jgi:hypothetical protein
VAAGIGGRALFGRDAERIARVVDVAYPSATARSRIVRQIPFVRVASRWSATRKVARVAGIVGCEPSDLAPKG